MSISKIKRIAALTILGSNIFAANLVNAAPIKPVTINMEKSSTEETVLKVNVSDSGELTYLEPARSGTALENKAFDWDNASVYFVITDRFENGNPSNDHSYGRSKNNGDYKNQPGTFHGGDIAGLTKKLNEGYFTDLGVNAIWITAPYEQIGRASCRERV